jgi:hypothetical protein
VERGGLGWLPPGAGAAGLLGSGLLSVRLLRGQWLVWLRHGCCSRQCVASSRPARLHGRRAAARPVHLLAQRPDRPVLPARPLLRPCTPLPPPPCAHPQVNDDWIMRRLERWGRRDGMPFVGPEKAALLQGLVQQAQPRLVVEVGTMAGYSAIAMAQVGEWVGS